MDEGGGGRLSSGLIFFTHVGFTRGTIFVLNIESSARFYRVSSPVLDSKVQK